MSRFLLSDVNGDEFSFINLEYVAKVTCLPVSTPEGQRYWLRAITPDGNGAYIGPLFVTPAEAKEFGIKLLASFDPSLVA